MDTRPLMVTIQCITYNHEPYIRQALEGFVMQKTNFRFEAIVHDDASTDGTAAIIREYAERYPDIIKPIYETENQYSKGDGSLGRIMDAHTHGKYVAICEGDDYCTDPNKLQMQVDFLEANPEYVMTHSDVMVHITSRNLFYRKGEKTDYLNLKYDENQNKLFKRILTNQYCIQTLSIMYRKRSFDEIPPNELNFMMGDTPLYLDLAMLGNIKFINKVIGVYNVHSTSVTNLNSNKIPFRFSMFEMRSYYCKKYNQPIPKVIKNEYFWAYRNLLLINPRFKPQFSPHKWSMYRQWCINKIASSAKFRTFFDKYNKFIVTTIIRINNKTIQLTRRTTNLLLKTYYGKHPSLQNNEHSI